VTYLEDDAANGGTGLHGLDWLRHLGVASHSCVPDAVVEVEAALGEGLEVRQFHA